MCLIKLLMDIRKDSVLKFEQGWAAEIIDSSLGDITIISRRDNRNICGEAEFYFLEGKKGRKKKFKATALSSPQL